MACAYSTSETVPDMRQIQPLIDTKVVTPAESALALRVVTEMELLRLKTIAKLHARGLPPDVGWDDLLQEALTRVLVGARLPPENVPIVAFLAGIMRSLKSEHWRRVSNRSARLRTLRIDQASDGARDIELRDPAPTPERSLSAQQELNTIKQLFAGDVVALKIIAGLAEDLSAEQIRSAHGISKTDYDSARKRMRRTLLREGLTCERK
jgi:DNA-directed RNA polymerase specialized sigma24 family protein